MGLVTGAGFVPLINLVNNRLSNETITDTDIILSIFKKSRERIKQSWYNDSQVDSFITQKGWIFSYYTFVNEVPTLKLGDYHENLNPNDLVLYEPGDPAIIYPFELTKQEVQRINPHIINPIVIPNNQSEIQSSIQKNIFT